MPALRVQIPQVFPYMRALGLLRGEARAKYQHRNAVVAMHLLLRDKLRDPGIHSWYSGLESELVRSILSSATLLMVRERVGVLTRRALVG